MIRTLAVLAVLQVALVGALYWPDAPQQDADASLVPGLAVADVQRIEVVDGEGASNALQRTPQGWRLTTGLPADSDRVDTLLAGLLTGDPGFAVATSDAAARRFKVDAEDFERRIRVSGEDSEQTVYLGSSPSFRKIHARREGEAAVYMIDLNSYDAPTDDGAWLDRSLLAVKQVDSIELYGLRFALQGDTWTRDDGDTVDAEAMEQLVQAVANLRVSGLVDEDDEDAGAAGEALRLTLGTGDEELRLTVLDNPEGERYYLRSDAWEPVFNTSAYDAERLIDAAKAAAGMAEEQAEPSESTGQADDDAGTDAADGGLDRSS